MWSDTSFPEGTVYEKEVPIKIPVTLLPGLTLRSPEKSIPLQRINTISMIIKIRLQCLPYQGYKKVTWTHYHSSQLSVFIAVKCTACKWKLALSVVLQTMGVLSVCLMIMTFSIAAFFEQSKSPQCFISAEGNHSRRENLRLVTLKTFSYFSAKLIKM